MEGRMGALPSIRSNAKKSWGEQAYRTINEALAILREATDRQSSRFRGTRGRGSRPELMRAAGDESYRRLIFFIADVWIPQFLDTH